jgi:hypothetical protein
VLDLRLDQKIGASGCLHHAYDGELRVIPWKLACMLYCSAVQSSVDGFAFGTLAPELGSTH